MTDITTIFRRLSLKQNSLINYIDFYNAVYVAANLGNANDGIKAIKSQKMTKKFINLINREQEEYKI